MGDIATYHGDIGRSGLNPNFSFSGALGNWRRYVLLPASAMVRAAPLYLDRFLFTTGPHAGETHDVVIVAATDNSVAAYAEDQILAGGLVNALWIQQPLGPASQRGGSNIHPLIGISGTPVIDRANATIYVMAYVAEASGDVFKIFALDLNTGGVVGQAALLDRGVTGRPTFDPTEQDQRGGLNLVNGWIYATFAAFRVDDLGLYHGWVVACNQNLLSQQIFLSTTKTVLGGGAWGPGGAAAAADGTLYVSTGNAPGVDDSYWANLPSGKRPGDFGDYFEGVVRVQHSGGTLGVVGWFQQPNATTKALNDNDEDFGGSSPIVLPPITGRHLIVTTAKDGNVYLLDSALGGSGAALANPNAFIGGPDGGSKCAPAYYHDPVSGKDFVYVSGFAAPGLAAYQVTVSGSTAGLSPAWKAALNFGGVPGSPFVIADPATRNAWVWVVDNTPSVVHACDAMSGALMFRSDAAPSDDVGPCPNFAPLVGAGKSVFVCTNAGLVGYCEMQLHPRFVADLRGNGHLDIVGFGNAGIWTALGNGDGTFQPPQLGIANFGYAAGNWRVEKHPRFLVRLTPNGRADFAGFGDAGVWTALSQGDGTFRMPLPQPVVANFGYIAGQWRIERNPRFLVDLFNQGFADIVAFGDDGVWTARGKGDGTFQPEHFVFPFFGYNAGNWRVDRHPRYLADLTGNRQKDIVGFGDDGVWTALREDPGTFQPPHFVRRNFGYNAGNWRVEKHPRFLADLRGNGKSDIVAFGDNGVWTALSDGGGGFLPESLVLPNFGYNAGNWRVDEHPRFLANLTDTGRADIVGFGDDGVWTALSDGGGGFSTPRLVLPNFGYAAGGWRVKDNPIFLSDLTGNGKSDIIGFGDEGVWVALGNGDGTFQSPKLALPTFGYAAGGWGGQET